MDDNGAAAAAAAFAAKKRNLAETKSDPAQKQPDPQSISIKVEPYPEGENGETSYRFPPLQLLDPSPELDEGDVTNVAVRRDRQREGIGNFLMESMIRLAEERGITMIHLEVRAGNETAIRLYERQGFVRDGLRKGYYTDPTEDAVLMTRTTVSE